MLDARHFLTEEQQGRAAYAITEAEKHTGAEILVAVATESGRYDRAESLCGLFFALLALGGLSIGIHGIAGPGSWAVAGAAGVGWQSTAVVLGFVAGSLLASYFHPVRRLFTSRREMEEEVRRGAGQVFMTHDLHSTTHRAGILIYLSLFERRVVVLPDAALRQAVGDALAKEVCEATQKELRAGRRIEGILGAVEVVARQLAEKFPENHDNQENQVPNRMLLIHPRP